MDSNETYINTADQNVSSIAFIGIDRAYPVEGPQLYL